MRIARGIARIALTILCAAMLFSDAPAAGKPTPEQVAWHEMEIEMFVCLDPCTWQGREYDDHSTPLSAINPADLDTDQWCEVAKSFGAKQILFVAKHTGGFCWWQTDTSEYSIKNTPYKDGKGDLLAELSESCKKHGLKLAVYIYPGDDQWGAGMGSGGKTKDPAKQEAYNAVLRRQWTEVLTKYGEISELWFDGSCVVELGDIIEKHAPRAMVFQGPHATLRWPGNEKGLLPDPAWQTLKRADAQSGVATGLHSDPEGDVWLPMEMDTTLLDHKWFWAPNTDHMMKSLDHLMDVYYKSVGRGSVLLLNATPDTTGLIPASHVKRYKVFGKAVARIYENKKGEISGAGSSMEIRFEGPTVVNHIVLMEDILRTGHAVRRYVVEGLVGDLGKGGTWEILSEGTSIGYKKIDRFESVTVEALRLRVVEAAGEPVFKRFAAYAVAGEERSVGLEHSEGASRQSVSEWNAAAWSDGRQTIRIDLTPYIPRPGQYEIELRNNGATVKVREIMLVVAGTDAPRLISPLDRPGRWVIRRTDVVTQDAGGRTSLRVVIDGSKSDKAKTELFIRGF